MCLSVVSSLITLALGATAAPLKRTYAHDGKVEVWTGPHHGSDIHPRALPLLELGSIWGTFARAGSALLQGAAKEMTAVGVVIPEAATSGEEAGILLWRKIALTGGLVGGGLLLDHYIATSTVSTNSSCPAQGGNDANAAVSADEIQLFQQSGLAGFTKLLEHSGIVKTSPTLTPTDGGAFTPGDLTMIRSNICFLDGVAKSTHLARVLATPGIDQTEKNAIEAASDGQCAQ